MAGRKVVWWGIVLAIGARAQLAKAPPAFEVASIQPANPNAHGTSTHTGPGRFAIENMSLKDCLMWAFDVKEFSFSGPAWLASPRFDIVAKPPAGASPAQYRVMMQTLLAERFGLAYHRVAKTVPAYALVVYRRRFLARPSPAGEPQGETWGRGLVQGRNETLAQFADLLSRHLNLPVVDETGIPGDFDIALRYVPDDATVDSATDTGAASSIFAALEEQAGLKLEKGLLPVQILVVDRIARQPTAN